MTFTNSHDSPLYSQHWMPASAGGYAGTCIFLVLLGVTFRLLWAAKVLLEIRWSAEAKNRRYVLIKGQSTEAARIDSDPDAKAGSLITVNGIEESVKVVKAGPRSIQPFRLSVDVPRAALFMIITGVGYLLYVFFLILRISLTFPGCWPS